MLKRMKDELSKYKTQNTRLQSELENVRSTPGDRTSTGESVSAKLTLERDSLQRSLDEIQKQSGLHISSLESQLSSIRADLAAAQAERDAHRQNHEELSRSLAQTRSELTQLKSENSMLEGRAVDAENKVTMLLDRVGQSVGNYRRQSQLIVPGAAAGHIGNTNHDGRSVNGTHERAQSPSQSSLASGGGTRDRADSSSQDELYTDNRGSLALDSLASELDALKSKWESTSRSYRLSNQFDFERTPTQESAGGNIGGGGSTGVNHGAELSESLANWRKRVDEEERGAKSGNGSLGLGMGMGMGGGKDSLSRERDGGMI